MKKWVLTVCAALVLCCFAGCSSHCKEQGCDNEVYKDGYCNYHYTLYQAAEAVQGVYDAFFG